MRSATLTHQQRLGPHSRRRPFLFSATAQVEGLGVVYDLGPGLIVPG